MSAFARCSMRHLPLAVIDHVGVEEQEVRDPDPDAERLHFDPQAVAECLDPRLRRAVRAHPGAAQCRRSRRDVEHIAAAALEVRERRPVRVHDAEQVDLDHPLPRAQVLRAQRPTGRDPGVRDDHVQSTERLGSRVDGLRDVLAVGHVALCDERVLATARRDLRHPLGLEADQREPRAV